MPRQEQYAAGRRLGGQWVMSLTVVGRKRAVRSAASAVGPRARWSMLNGIDEIGHTLTMEGALRADEERRRPWWDEPSAADARGAGPPLSRRSARLPEAALAEFLHRATVKGAINLGLGVPPATPPRAVVEEAVAALRYDLIIAARGTRNTP